MSIIRSGWKPSLDLKEMGMRFDNLQPLTDRPQQSKNSSLNSSLSRFNKTSHESRKKNHHSNMESTKVGEIFNTISDLNDKAQISKAISQLDSKESRIMLIDRILKRQQEKHNADEIVQMSKVQPLLTRFIKKLKKPALAFYENSNPKNNNNKSTNNDNNKEKSSDKAVHFSTLPSEIASPILEENNDGQVKVKGEATDLENRARLISIFFGNKKKKDDKEEQINSMSQVAEMLIKNSDGIGRNINLNKISEDSMQLIKKGREMQRLKANELLKDGQRQNLASHFKSKQFKNRFGNQKQWTSNPDINTFNTEPDEEAAKIEKQKMETFLNHQNLLDASRVVEQDVQSYIQKQYSENALQFLVSPGSIKNPISRSIENRILFNTQLQTSPEQSIYKLNKRIHTSSSKLNTRSNSTRKHSYVPSCLNFYQDIPKTPPSPQSNADFFNYPLSSRDNHQLQSRLLTTQTSSSAIGVRPNTYRLSTSRRGTQRPQSQPFNGQLSERIRQVTINGTSLNEIPKDFTLTKSSKPLGSINFICDIGNNIQSPQLKFEQNVQTNKQKQEKLLSQQKQNSSNHKKHFSSNSQSFGVGKYDFDQLYQTQRDKTGVEKKKHFSYNLAQQYLFNNFKTEISDPIASDTKQQKQGGEYQISKFDIIDSNPPVALINNTINIVQKAVKTVDKWKLDREIAHTGNSDNNKQAQIPTEEVKDDESLVSFTEIKLDKLYKKTMYIQSNQRALQDAHDQENIDSPKVQEVDKAKQKNITYLTQIKKDIFHATQTKLKPSRRLNCLS